MLQDLQHFDDLRFVYLFGSAATGDATERSDVDLCLYYDLDDEQELADLLYEISGMLSSRYDIHFFQFLPRYVQKEVFRGRLLYTSDRGFVHDLAYHTRRAYEDFEPRYRLILHGKAGVEASR